MHVPVTLGVLPVLCKHAGFNPYVEIEIGPAKRADDTDGAWRWRRMGNFEGEQPEVLSGSTGCALGLAEVPPTEVRRASQALVV